MKHREASVCCGLSVCLSVNIEAAVSDQTPSRLIRQRWSCTRSASSAVDMDLGSSAGTPACDIARSNPVHDLCCLSSPHFPLARHCLVSIWNRRQFSKIGSGLRSMMQGDWNWPPDCSEETTAIQYNWLQWPSWCFPQLQFKMKGLDNYFENLDL